MQKVVTIHSMVNKFRQHSERIVIGVFFLGYLSLGLWVVADYGLPYDDPLVRKVGFVNLNYILHGDQTLLEYADRYYGPVFQMLLAGLEYVLQLTDSRAIYLMRHVMTFLLFYSSVVTFFSLCTQRFKNWKIGLFGSLLLILSPRIFASSFYNSKDLAFLAVFIISIYTLTRYWRNPTWLRLAVHAIVCAMLTDIRIMGVIVPGLTCGYTLVETLVIGRGTAAWKKTTVAMVQYVIIFFVVMRLFFPILWERPFWHFTQGFAEMMHYPSGLTVLYAGQFIKAQDLPWHYLPVWIAISTPLLYVALFGLGLVVVVRSLATNPLARYFTAPYREDLLFVLWFWLPLAGIIALDSVVFDGWRHMLFVYPGFLLIALHGVVALLNLAKRFKGARSTTITILVLTLIVLGLAEPLLFMIRNHPYEDVYFNRLAGENMAIIKQKFELDYWGLSYTEALRYIAQHDSSPEIPVVVDQFPRTYCNTMLPAQDRERIVCVGNIKAAKYFVGNYRMNPNGYPCEREFYSISVDGEKIAVVHNANTCKTE